MTSHRRVAVPYVRAQSSLGQDLVNACTYMDPEACSLTLCNRSNALQPCAVLGGKHKHERWDLLVCRHHAECAEKTAESGGERTQACVPVGLHQLAGHRSGFQVAIRVQHDLRNHGIVRNHHGHVTEQGLYIVSMITENSKCQVQRSA